jgi:hypothetical protein
MTLLAVHSGNGIARIEPCGAPVLEALVACKYLILFATCLHDCGLLFCCADRQLWHNQICARTVNVAGCFCSQLRSQQAAPCRAWLTKHNTWSCPCVVLSSIQRDAAMHLQHEHQFDTMRPQKRWLIVRAEEHVSRWHFTLPQALPSHECDWNVRGTYLGAERCGDCRSQW